MSHLLNRRAYLSIAVGFLLAVIHVAAVEADEIWVAPTLQQDVGGLGIGSNVLWPVTPIGAVRLAWGVPNDLQTFQSAKVVLIPHAPAGAANLNLIICEAQHGSPVTGACAGPFAQPFVGVTNQLQEVDISAIVGPRVGAAGLNNLAVLAFTTPTTASDHIVGLRFAYDRIPPGNMATLGANTFTGTQTAPAFVGDGSALTNLPVPSGAATLGANTFSGTQTAPAFVGNGSGLTNLPVPAGAATLGANTFTATQTISLGNLGLASSTATSGNVTKGGQLFLHNTGGNVNTFVGVTAGNLTMTGLNNTGLGFNALNASTTGFDNTAAGVNALKATNSGSQNVAYGSDALANNTTGFTNAAFGVSALKGNTIGSGNIAVGLMALTANTIGNGNVAVGSAALGANVDGFGNTAAGQEALQAVTSGHGNVGVGKMSLQMLSTGHENTAVGDLAGSNSTTGSNNIYLGANIPGVAGESNTMYLGSVGTQTKTFIAGVRGATTVNSDAIPVLVDSAGQLGTISSSRRFKEDIEDMAATSRRLFDLRPVTFRYRQAFGDGSKPIQYGLVAEEVAETFPELAVRGLDGNVETVHYEMLNVLLLNEVQRQDKKIADQGWRIEVLERRIEKLLGR